MEIQKLGFKEVQIPAFSLNLINHHFPNLVLEEIPVMFSQLNSLTSALMERIPQREKERGAREGERKRERDWGRVGRLCVMTGSQLNWCRRRAQTTQTFAGRSKPSLQSRVELGEEETRGHDSDNCATTFSAVLAVAVWNLEHNRWVNVPLCSN